MRAFGLIRGLLVWLCVLFALSPQIMASQLEEYELKAGFIFNFTHFIKWPPAAFPSDESPFVLGVAGSAATVAIMENALRNEKVEGRPLRIVGVTGRKELEGVHLLFLPGILRLTRCRYSLP